MQFEFPGALAVPDGSYLARGEAARETVLVVETLRAPAPPSRRRRRPLEDDAAPQTPSLPLGRATAVRAWEPFSSREEASQWLDSAVAARDSIDDLIGEGIALLNRALHARAIAGGEAHFYEETAERAERVRLGYGSGEELSAGRFSVARDIDLRQRATSRRAKRDEELRPQERIAAVLAGRERPDVCETLVLRVCAELDSGRLREAALQLPAALQAVLVELPGSLVDPGHEEDLKAIAAHEGEAKAAAGIALRAELDSAQAKQVRELARLAERLLRRRRIRRG